MGFAWFQGWISASPEASDKTGSPTSKSVMDGLAFGMDEGSLLEMTAAKATCPWGPLLGDSSDHLWLWWWQRLPKTMRIRRDCLTIETTIFFLELAVGWWFRNCLTIQQLGNTGLTRVKTSDWIRSNWMVWEIISLSLTFFFKLFHLITILNWLVVGWFYNYVRKLFEEIGYMDLVGRLISLDQTSVWTDDYVPTNAMGVVVWPNYFTELTRDLTSFFYQSPG